MDDLLSGYPFWAVWLFLYFGATMRGQATYWIGRGIMSGATRSRRGPGWWRSARDRLADTQSSAGRRVLEKAGLVAIPLAYLTVGLQSAIIFAAGLIRIPWHRFSLAQIPGAVAWATIYSTIGFAAWASVARALAGDWWPLALLAVVAVVVVVVFVVRRRRRTRSDESRAHGSGGDRSERLGEICADASVGSVTDQRRSA